MPDSNQRLDVYETPALPTELMVQTMACECIVRLFVVCDATKSSHHILKINNNNHFVCLAGRPFS